MTVHSRIPHLLLNHNERELIASSPPTHTRRRASTHYLLNPRTPLTSRNGAVMILEASCGVVSVLVMTPFFTYSTSTG